MNKDRERGKRDNVNAPVTEETVQGYETIQINFHNNLQL